MSNTTQSLDMMRKLGALCQVVEQTIRIPGGRTFKRDLFGCIDILCVLNGAMIGIQACSRVDHNKRLQKALEEPRLRQWLTVDTNYFEVHSWAKQGPRGKVKHWNCRAQPVLLDEHGQVEAQEPYIPQHMKRIAIEAPKQLGDGDVDLFAPADTQHLLTLTA